MGEFFARAQPHTFIQPEKRSRKMGTRRDVASIVGLGAMAAATLASPAVAQTAADSNESTFARIRRTKKMRIGAVGGGAPYYMKDLASGQWKGFYIDI